MVATQIETKQLIEKPIEVFDPKLAKWLKERAGQKNVVIVPENVWKANLEDPNKPVATSS